MFFKPEPYDLYPSEVRDTNPVDSQEIHFTYITNVTEKTSKVEQWMVELPSQLFIFLFTSLLMFSMVCIIDVYLPHSYYRTQKYLRFDLIQLRLLYLLCPILNATFSFTVRQPFRIVIGLFVLSCSYRFVSIIICTLIQTNLLVIDTSDISFELRHLLRSSRGPCYVEGDKYVNYFKYADPNSLYGRIWRRGLQNPCFIARGITSYKHLRRLLNTYVFCEESYM